jgi:hypothetical protein
MLQDPDAKVPFGQLATFVAKVGFNPETAKTEGTQIKQQNILAILPGLPEERRGQIAAQLRAQAEAAEKLVKELPGGSR